jgi:hypothetical protein
VIAIKIIDGSWRPIGPIIMETFKQWNFQMPDESIYVYGGDKIIGRVKASNFPII